MPVGVQVLLFVSGVFQIESSHWTPAGLSRVHLLQDPAFVYEESADEDSESRSMNVLLLSLLNKPRRTRSEEIGHTL